MCHIDFSNGGLLKSIRRGITDRGFKTIYISEHYWVDIQVNALDIRNGYVQGKNEQNAFVSDSKGAAGMFQESLSATKETYVLAKADTKWIDEYCKRFASLKAYPISIHIFKPDSA